MTRHINLYDPALLRKRELLTFANLAAAAFVLLSAVLAWGGWARSQAAAIEAESQSAAAELKALQDQVGAATKRLAGAKLDPRIEAELASVRALLAARDEVVAALKKGLDAESPGFAEYLRGFARQTPHGLWLTGFSIGEGGSAMEIRGRMTDPALLSEYIRRLNGEKAFKGQAFAALNIGAPPQAPDAKATVTPGVLEFTLIPVRQEAPQEQPVATENRR